MMLRFSRISIVAIALSAYAATTVQSFAGSRHHHHHYSARATHTLFAPMFGSVDDRYPHFSAMPYGQTGQGEKARRSRVSSQRQRERRVAHQKIVQAAKIKAAALIANPAKIPLYEDETIAGAAAIIGSEFDRALVQAAADAKAYLIATAHPGYTMTRQGTAQAIGKLHPVFALRLAAAVKEARSSGLPDVGVFSAYRPPAFGVGGFRNKYESPHSYGLATDMKYIGKPGSAESKKWNAIAISHGVFNPYFGRRWSEWNHYQAVAIKIMPRGPLRASITARGPKDEKVMWAAADPFLGKAKEADISRWNGSAISVGDL